MNEENFFWMDGQAVGLELFAVLIIVFSSSFFGLLSTTATEGRGGWAVTCCICTALISIIYAGIQINFAVVLGWREEWHRVFLIVLLVGAYGLSVVSILWRWWR